MINGAIPSSPDSRDAEFFISSFTNLDRTFPDQFRVSGTLIPYDQGRTNMCVAFSLVQACEVAHEKEFNVRPRLSPLFIYGNRPNGSYIGEGMEIRTALKQLKSDGVPLYEHLPGIGDYKVAITVVRQNKTSLLPEARQHQIATYSRLTNSQEIRAALQDFGPVICCMKVGQGFLQLKGRIFDPSKDEPYGYHAMAIVGWDHVDGHLCWELVNSWGPDWADHGYALVPSGYPHMVETWSIVDLVASP